MIKNATVYYILFFSLFWSVLVNLVVAAVTTRGGSDARVRLCEIVSYEIFSDDPAF